MLGDSVRIYSRTCVTMHEKPRQESVGRWPLANDLAAVQLRRVDKRIGRHPVVVGRRLTTFQAGAHTGPWYILDIRLLQ